LAKAHGELRQRRPLVGEDRLPIGVKVVHDVSGSTECEGEGAPEVIHMLLLELTDAS